MTNGNENFNKKTSKYCKRWPHLVIKIPKAEDGLLLDLAEDGEEGRLHAVTVQGVLSRLRIIYKQFYTMYRCTNIVAVLRIKCVQIQMLLVNKDTTGP